MNYVLPQGQYYFWLTCNGPGRSHKPSGSLVNTELKYIANNLAFSLLSSVTSVSDSFPVTDKGGIPDLTFALLFTEFKFLGVTFHLIG